MGFFNRLFGKKNAPNGEGGTAVAEASEITPRPDLDADDLIDAEAAQGKKSVFGRLESKVRRRVDSYVDKKAGKLMGDALEVAQEFREETLSEVHNQAMQLLDLTEERIDGKLVEIEAMLEKRLRAELKMRLRALIWTLAFVLVMAGVSFAYVWFKQQAGLKADNTTGSELRRPGSEF